MAEEPLHGKVIRVVGGDIITLVDARQREHQLRLAFIDAPVPGQPFSDKRNQPCLPWCSADK